MCTLYRTSDTIARDERSIITTGDYGFWFIFLFIYLFFSFFLFVVGRRDMTHKILYLRVYINARGIELDATSQASSRLSPVIRLIQYTRNEFKVVNKRARESYARWNAYVCVRARNFCNIINEQRGPLYLNLNTRLTLTKREDLCSSREYYRLFSVCRSKDTCLRIFIWRLQRYQWKMLLSVFKSLVEKSNVH